MVTAIMGHIIHVCKCMWTLAYGLVSLCVCCCRYNPKKGFYCQVLNENHTKCLGRSKGRIYPPMELKAEQYLQAYYKRYNVALSKLLTRLSQDVPGWLQEELRTVE